MLTTTTPVKSTTATAATTAPTVAICSNEHVLQHFRIVPPKNDTIKNNNTEQEQQYYRLWSPSLQQEACPRQILANKFVLIVLGASYCGPCKQIKPVMLQFYTSVKERYQQQRLGIIDHGDDHDEMNDDTRIDLEIVFCCMDHTEIAYEACTRDMPWWCVPFENTALRDALFRLHGGGGSIPHVTVLDYHHHRCDSNRSSSSSNDNSSSSNGILVHDGLVKILADPTGLAFPWRPNQRLVDILPRHYLMARQQQQQQHQQSSCLHRNMSELNDKYLFIYAAAQWCESSREFTPKLCQTYTALQQQGKNVEILFLSSDKDQASFWSFWQEEMNFGAIDFDNRRVKALFADKFQIKSIPTLLLFGPRRRPLHSNNNNNDDDDDRPLLNANVRGIIEQQAAATTTAATLATPQQSSSSAQQLADDDFPISFMPPRYGDLNQMTDSLNSVRCIVIFCHEAPVDQQDAIRQALKGAAALSTKSSSCNIAATTTTAAAADLRFLWSCKPTPFSNTLQEALRLDPIQCQQRKEPLMVLLDISHDGAFYIHETKNTDDEKNDKIIISPASILAFVQNPGQRSQI